MGDSPSISQQPYGLALRHVQWVQDEIETLERAGVITKSVSPWASPIVIVPKKTSPGEPPPYKDVCRLQNAEFFAAKGREGTYQGKGHINIGTNPKD